MKEREDLAESPSLVLSSQSTLSRELGVSLATGFIYQSIKNQIKM